MTERPIVSQAEFARLRGVSRKTVTAWKRQERLLLTSDGKVDVAGSEKLLALRPGIYRGGKIKAAPGEKQATGKDVPPILDRSPEEIADSTKWTLIEAQRVKEVYLALLRKQEFEIEQGELVEIEAVGREVEREYSMVRERLLTIPGKVSASLAGCDRAVIESKLLDEITEALAELHEPGKSDGGQREGAPAPRSRQNGRSGRRRA
jgi:hypothetical protein